MKLLFIFPRASFKRAYFVILSLIDSIHHFWITIYFNTNIAMCAYVSNYLVAKFLLNVLLRSTNYIDYRHQYLLNRTHDLLALTDPERARNLFRVSWLCMYVMCVVFLMKISNFKVKIDVCVRYNRISAYCVPTLCVLRTVLIPPLNTAYQKRGGGHSQPFNL